MSEPSSVLFVHHSIGRQLIEEGGLRGALSGVELWDHDYNDIGLTDPRGARTGLSFPVPDDDTDPPGLLRLLDDLAAGRLANVPDHDVLVLKSCFPNSHIADAAQGDDLRALYAELAERAKDLPQRVVLLSSPPLVAEATTRDAAARADELADWLDSVWSDPGLGYVNLFASLSHRRGPLRGTLHLTYRKPRPRDSHLSVRGARAGAAAVAAALTRRPAAA